MSLAAYAGPLSLVSCAGLLLAGLLLNERERSPALLRFFVLFDLICYVVKSLEAEHEKHEFVVLCRADVGGLKHSLLDDSGESLIERRYLSRGLGDCSLQ